MTPDPNRYGVVALLILAPLAWPAAPARAQDGAHRRARAGAFFAGGSVATWWNAGAKQDPEGAGYLMPYYHGSLGWPALGAVLGGGVFATHTFAVGAEIAFRRQQSAIVSEDERAKFEAWHLTPRYTDRERLISITNRWNLQAGSIDLQPVWGVTFSHTTQSMTERTGTYAWYAGTMPIQRPDRSVDASQVGIVGGADVVLDQRHGVAVTCTGRLHWIRRTEYDTQDRVAPAEGPFVIYMGAGVTWWPARR